MNPNPRSDTIFFTVPFGIARSPPLEHRIERIGPVRERRMRAAREITRRPGERVSFSTLPRRTSPAIPSVFKFPPPLAGEGRVGVTIAHDLVQPAEVRSRAVGDHGGGQQHYLCSLEYPRRPGAATPLIHPEGDPVPRQPGGEPGLRAAPDHRADPGRGWKLGSERVDHRRLDTVRRADHRGRRLLLAGDEAADPGARGGGRGLAGLPAAGWAGADLWDRQYRDRACDRLPHGRQALPLRPFPSPACGGG